MQEPLHDAGKTTAVGHKPSFNENEWTADGENLRLASRSKGAAGPWLNGIVLWAALNVFANAYSTAIIASSLGQPTFAAEFGFATRPNVTQLISAAVGGNQVGGFIGQFIMATMSERYGRKKAMAVSLSILILGIALSGGCANGNWPMFISARILVGMGGWPTAAIALTYQSEVAIAEIRGWLTGTVGLAFGLGYTAAACVVGVGLFYWNATFAWRLPLILGLIFPLLSLALLPIIPETPRWLCLHGRSEEAYAIIKRMHNSKLDPDHLYAKAEFAEVQAQTAHDATLDASWIGLFKKKSNFRRFWLTVLLGTVSSSTAIQVITSYGPALYTGYGFSAGNSLLIAGGWITIAAIEPFICMLVLDHLGRRFLLLASIGGCAFTLSIIAALSKYYGAGTASALSGGISPGGGALIAMIYVHLIVYLLHEAAIYVYFGEIWPSHLRAKGSALGLAAIQLSAAWLTWATPTALITIQWKYWLVFTVICAVGVVILWFVVPETMRVPLEEIAELFGDKEDVMMHIDDIKTRGHTNEKVVPVY